MKKYNDITNKIKIKILKKILQLIFRLYFRLYLFISCFILFILFFNPVFSQELNFSLELNKVNFFLNEPVIINLEEDYYKLNNTNSFDNLTLKIISPNHYYNYLGGLDKRLIFQPNEIGKHYIELYFNNELVKKLEFIVFETNSQVSENSSVLNNLNISRNNIYNNVSENQTEIMIIQNSNFSTKQSNIKLLDIIKINVKQNYSLDENVFITLTKNEQTLYAINPREDINFSKLIIHSNKDYVYENPKNKIIFKPSELGKHEIILYDTFDNEVARASFNVIENKKFIIKDSKGKKIDATFQYKDKIKKNISELISEIKNEKNQKIELTVLPNLKNIKKITFKDINLENSFDFYLEDLDTFNLERSFIKAYAINPENLDFSEAILTSISQGKTLYKCAEWNFQEQKCYGIWKKIMSLVPGQEYNVIITKNDPAYAESNELIEPKPVSGFVFMSDNTRANNGIPVRIFNKANGESVLTQVYAPPIPIYKGAYSANIYGITGDSIVVRAWNSTHYGETNATLLATTTYVNITIQYFKGSEPNVSIIYPLNNSIFYLGQNFNITAKVQILNNNAEKCYASFISTLAEPITGQSNTIFLGDIMQNNEITFMFNLTAIKGGYEKLIVNVSCSTDTILDGLNIARVNLTFIDNVKPEITIFKPLNNEESLNPIKFIFNVSDHTGIKNCSLIFNGNLNQTIFNPQMYILHSFNLTLQAGTYNYNIDCYDNSTLFNYNITETINFFLPSWHFYYGNISSKIFLGSGEIEKYSWETYSEAYLYVIETNTVVDWNNLQALGRDKFNNSEFNDFNEADINLSMQNFVDSINNTFTQNYQPKKLVNLTIFGKRINNIPVINSTNNSNFITGILWEMTGNNYNGSQNLIFFTNKSIAKQGKFGLYEYEIRIPANLKNYKLNSGTITFYTEII
ncbi:MAG: hypothetical protein QXE31_02075 [Candidatus Woesearchaeota archaeon]